MRNIVLVAALAQALIAPLSNAQTRSVNSAADYPSQTVRMIVPFAAGGATDLVARQVARKLEETWKQPVIIDNRGGAGGNIGAHAVAKAPGDGYTLLLGSMGPMVINQFLQKDLPFDPAKDFAPISNLVTVKNVLVVPASLPVRSVQELIAYAKANPGKLNYASSGIGATDHLAAEAFKDMAKVDMVHVAFKGGAPAVLSVMAGETPVSFATAPTVLSHIQGGKLRALGVTGSSRLPSLPGTPTIDEAGVNGFDVTTWFGLFAPASTPTDIVAKLNRDVVQALRDPDVRKVLVDNGLETAPTTVSQFAEQIKEDTVKWSRLIRKFGITAN